MSKSRGQLKNIALVHWKHEKLKSPGKRDNQVALFVPYVITEEVEKRAHQSGILCKSQTTV